MANLGPSNIMEHPIEAVKDVMGQMGIDPRMKQSSAGRTLMESNDGPAMAAARITGVKRTTEEKDTDPYFTNNEGIPWPDPAHSLNVGGIPVVSDTFLLQKQQTFNRSKNLERMYSLCVSVLGR